MAGKDALTIQDQIRRNMRRLRESIGATRNNLARRAQEFGFAWTERTVTKIENGERRLSLEETVSLPVFFEGTRLADFLAEPEERLALNEHLTIPTEAVAQILSGATASQAGIQPRPQPVDWSALRYDWDRTDAIISHLTAEGHLHFIGDVGSFSERSFGELALPKVAARLGEEPRLVVMAVARMYGRTLTEERDVRAREIAEPGDTPRTTQAKRGRATHEITKELRRVFDGFD